MNYIFWIFWFLMRQPYGLVSCEKCCRMQEKTREKLVQCPGLCSVIGNKQKTTILVIKSIYGVGVYLLRLNSSNIFPYSGLIQTIYSAIWADNVQYQAGSRAVELRLTTQTCGCTSHTWQRRWRSAGPGRTRRSSDSPCSAGSTRDSCCPSSYSPFPCVSLAAFASVLVAFRTFHPIPRSHLFPWRFCFVCQQADGVNSTVGRGAGRDLWGETSRDGLQWLTRLTPAFRVDYKCFHGLLVSFCSIRPTE